MSCNKETEIERRTKRATYSNEKSKAEVMDEYDVRNSQYVANILPHMKNFDIILESKQDYSLDIIGNNPSVDCFISEEIK